MAKQGGKRNNENKDVISKMKDVYESLLGLVILSALLFGVYKLGYLNSLIDRFAGNKKVALQGLSPRETVKLYFEFGQDGGKRGVLACMDPDCDAYKAIKRTWSISSVFKDQKVSMLNQAIDGDTATVRVKQKDLSPDGSEVYMVWDQMFHLKKKEGVWKIYKVSAIEDK